MTNFARSRQELESEACKWWPEDLKQAEANKSIIPLLIETQDQFISILTLSNSDNIESIFKLIEDSNFPANLFLKHLIVLTDFGSEPLQRINRDFTSYFPEGVLETIVNGKTIKYHFDALPSTGSLSNKRMLIDSQNLSKNHPMNSLFKDLIVMLLFGGNSTDNEIANILNKCIVGNLLGKHDELSTFVKQRYIYVSRITGGAQANNLGNIAQEYVCEYLIDNLNPDYKVTSNGHIPGVTQNDGRTLMSFDVVVEHDGKYVATEVSFQVTTNSTIERKAGQALFRHNSVKKAGCFITYIIDGAGNFQRTSALDTICDNSDCTVAFTEGEFDILLDFIKEKI